VKSQAKQVRMKVIGITIRDFSEAGLIVKLLACFPGEKAENVC
jgi:hypothetical protein